MRGKPTITVGVVAPYWEILRVIFLRLKPLLYNSVCESVGGAALTSQPIGRQQVGRGGGGEVDVGGSSPKF